VIAGPAVSKINRLIPLEAKIAKEQIKLGVEVDEYIKAQAARIERAPATKGVITDSAAEIVGLIETIPADLSIPDFLKRMNFRGRDHRGSRGPTPGTEPVLNHWSLRRM
jgi:hypothetical protein